MSQGKGCRVGCGEVGDVPPCENVIRGGQAIGHTGGNVALASHKTRRG